MSIDLTKILGLVRDGANEGLLLGSEHVLGVARAQTPIEEGTLERSGVASQDPGTLRAAVSFDTPYSVVQHEDMTLAHDAGRSAKFLENALNAEATTVAQLVATGIRNRLGT